MTERLYNIAFGSNRKSMTWNNKSISWDSFINKLRITKRTAETVEEYFNMDKEKRGDIKDIGGFVCGYCENGKRNKASIKNRCMITLDLDNNPNIEEVWQRAKLFKSVLYTTHSHTPDSPRLRIITPLDREVTPEEYSKVSKALAYYIGNNDLDIFDKSTYDVNRLMYLPSTCKDGEFIFKDSGDRPIAKVNKLLGLYDRDIDKLQIDNRGNQVQDPREKDGYIGAFCKAYNIYEVISTYLFNEYEKGSKENRYTYLQGHSGDGLEVYNDGLFAYSHQDTDPISGKGSCNSFDLVRYHLFGSLDSEEDIKNLPPNKLTSFKKMCELVVNDDKANAYLTEEEFNKVEDPILKKDFTNDGLLKDFKNTYGKDIKYVSDMGVYIIWNGSLWSITDENAIHKNIIRYIHNLINQVEDYIKQPNSEDWIKKVYTRLKNLTVVKIIKNNFKAICDWVDSSELDNNDNLLNCKNGMLDLKTMKLLPHDKEALCTKILNIDYVPEAKCDNFISSLNWIFADKDTRKELQKAYGYSITGETIHEVLFILWGKGLNGKSTITKPLRDIFGDYFGSLSYKSLEPRKDNSAPSSDFAKLVNKRVVLTSESKCGFTIDDGVLKTITSGEILSARFMRQNEFDYNPKFKLWVPTNILPYIRNTDFGFWRRLIIFPCNNRPKKDIKGFYDKYIKSEELPGILNWAIEGLKILNKEGFNPTEEMKKAADSYRQEVNPVERFIKECCILEPEGKIKTTDLLYCYNRWTYDEGYSEMKMKTFRNRLADLGYEVRKSNNNLSFTFGIAEIKEDIEKQLL